jgi:hypothetical protein
VAWIASHLLAISCHWVRKGRSSRSKQIRNIQGIVLELLPGHEALQDSDMLGGVWKLRTVCL